MGHVPFLHLTIHLWHRVRICTFRLVFVIRDHMSRSKCTIMQQGHLKFAAFEHSNCDLRNRLSLAKAWISFGFSIMLIYLQTSIKTLQIDFLTRCTTIQLQIASFKSLQLIPKILYRIVIKSSERSINACPLLDIPFI